MGLEQVVNYHLNKYPVIKKVFKRSYQLLAYAISHKIKSEGDIIKLSPNDDKEYFFGYYDKSPWDASGRYMLCLRANNTWSDVSPKEIADIILIDTDKSMSDPARVKKIAETRSWNVQQGCMLQWLGSDYDKKIIFNDFRNNKYCSVILEVSTGKETIIGAPVYSVSADGKFALTLDFSRLYSLRPGYGYYNETEKTKDVALPDATAVWTVDLVSQEVKPLLKYNNFASFEPRKEMQVENSVHKVNHIMLSPNGKRFMILYRWFNGSRKYTRLITCNVDGTEMYVLSDDDMVSHCYWKNDEEIIAFENKHGTGTGYYLMKDKTREYKHLWKQITNDGHPSYSPDGQYVLIDSYPNKARIADIKILKDTNNYMQSVAKVFAPFKYDNDTRCDLHPRWNREGNKVCFDSVYEGRRGLYMVDCANLLDNKIKKVENSMYKNGLVSVVIPTYKRSDTLSRAVDSVLAQTYKDVEVLVVDDNVPGSDESKLVQKVMEQYNGKSNVIYVSQEKHINGAVARNVGIKRSQGEFIAFLDDDDEWEKSKIEKQISHLSKHPDIDGVSALYTIMRNGEVVRKCEEYTTENLHKKIISREIAMFTSTILLKRKALDKSGYFCEELLRHQDLQLLLDFAYENKMDVIKEHLVVLHSDSDINRPNSARLIEIKEHFFSICKNHLLVYGKKEQRQIMAAHYFEIIFAALKEKKINVIIKYLFKVGFNLNAYKDVARRWKNRQ